MFSASRSWTALAVVLLAATAASQAPTILGGGSADARGKLEPNTGGTSYALCFGDSTGAPCPTRNFGAPGRGCENSMGAGGGLLWTRGVARVSSDTFKLHVDGLPRKSTVLYLQGTSSPDGGRGRAFGDGLSCLSGSLVRLGTSPVENGSSVFPPYSPCGCHASISMLGGIPPQGGTRYYQALYRDDTPMATEANFNLSNGWVQVWEP